MVQSLLSFLACETWNARSVSSLLFSSKALPFPAASRFLVTASSTRCYCVCAFCPPSTISRTHHSWTLVSSLFSSGCQLQTSRFPCLAITTSASGPLSTASPVALSAPGGVGMRCEGRRTSGSTGGREGEEGRMLWRTGARMKVASKGASQDDAGRTEERKGSGRGWEKDCSCRKTSGEKGELSSSAR